MSDTPAFGKVMPISKWMFSVLMGRSGSGKTEAIRSMIKAGFKVAHLDTDGGARTVMDLVNNPNYTYADCTTPEGYNKGWGAIKSGELDSSWVLFYDGLTGTLNMTVEAKEAKGDFDGSNAFKPWREIGNMTNAILKAGKLRSLNRHFVMTVLEEYEQDAEGQREWRANLAGKMSGKIFAQQIDAIWRMKVIPDPIKGATGVKYVTYTTALPNAETKFRCPPDLREQIPDIIDSSDIGDNLKLVADYKSSAATKGGK